MPLKRRAGSPTHDQRSSKRLSLMALAAKASSGSLRYEPEGSFLSIFMPQGRLRHSSTVDNLRSPSRPQLRPPPIRLGLELSRRPLITHKDSDIASIKELLVFPISLAMIKSNWIFRYNVNTTPQLGPPLPDHIENMLYEKYVSSRLYPRPGRLPYIHLGSTALGFKINFYLVLPYVSTASASSGSGNLCYSDLQMIYDHVIRPALEISYPRRHGWTSWIDAKNESHLQPLKARRRSVRREPQEECMHCDGLGAFWSAIEECSDSPEVSHLMRGMTLIAYGDVAVHDWQTDWRPTWAQFTQLWNDGVDDDYLGLETKLTLEMSLSFDHVVKDFGSAPRSASGSSRKSRRESKIDIQDFPIPPDYPNPNGRKSVISPGRRSATPPSVINMPPLPPRSNCNTPSIPPRASSAASLCSSTSLQSKASTSSSSPHFVAPHASLSLQRKASKSSTSAHFAPPPVGPPNSPLPPLPPNAVFSKNRGRRQSARHSIKLVEDKEGSVGTCSCAELEG